MVNGDLHSMLVEIAKRGGLDTYGNVSKYFGWDMGLPKDRDRISRALYDISWEEYRNDRPLLSAVIVRGDKGMPTSDPGKGFYVMAREMGFEFSDDLDFFYEQLKRVHDYWADKD